MPEPTTGGSFTVAAHDIETGQSYDVVGLQIERRPDGSTSCAVQLEHGAGLFGVRAMEIVASMVNGSDHTVWQGDCLVE